MAYYIGLISGTSVDGIDTVLCQIEPSTITLVESLCFPIPRQIQQKIHQIASGQYADDPIEMMGFLDVELGQLLSQAVDALLDKAYMTADQITAIGSHGQTIRHIPNHQQAFSLQIGDANIIVANTDITTVADFRRRDMAYGGQGAPLVPAFHQIVMSSDKEDRVIVNLGGIANISVLAKDKEVIGYDTGPANTLMDCWIKQHQDKDFDLDGNWAKSGDLIPELLGQMLADPYFAELAPKSTGREYFNLEWLAQFEPEQYQPQDVQRTLLELTAHSLSDAIDNHLTKGAIYLCGGGAHNAFLVERINVLIPEFSVQSSFELGIDPDWVEAMTFAWLAYRTINQQTGNLSSVTGASQETILGAIYYA